jgi:hypothetical protein
MAEEDFEIDLYGDANNEQTEGKAEDSDSHTYPGDDHHTNGEQGGEHGGEGGDFADDRRHQEDDMDRDQSHDQHSTSQSVPPQGVKRKSDSGDDRPVDPGATTALLVSELNWWNTDDEIRGWARLADCEDELKDITFSEHKVNGKCKG